MTRTTAAMSACAVALPSVGFAQGAPDKSAYTLANPTPRELRRPLSADRPDATESPYTVDAGAAQVEMSVAEYALRESGGVRGHSWSVAPMNLKIGLTNSIDVQFLLDPYLIDDDPEAGRRTGAGGSGLRLKMNVFGNDSGDAALALLPYVLFPTGDPSVAPRRVEGGLIVPFAYAFAEGWSLGLQGEIAFVRDGDDSGYDTVFSHTAVVGREIGDRLGVFVEYIGEYPGDGAGNYSPSVSGGFTIALTADAQFDAGVVVGLDRPETETVRVFAGVTLRY